jgi:hypothetical protein
MTQTQIVTGDDIDLSISLQTSAGVAVNVSAATEIKVALVNTGRTGYQAGPYTASSGTSGASWSTGVVVVRIPSADSTAITVSVVEVEVQVIIASVKTTYLGVATAQVVRGVIP